MNLRTVAVAPLLLAAVLHAQETPPAQGPTPEQQAERLKGEKQRLEQEIKFARERVKNANSLLSKKLGRGKPKFRSIDAGRSGGMLSAMPKRVERKVARVGTPEEMKIGGGEAMVVVNRRGISEKLYNDVAEYLKSYSAQANPDLIAQRVLYDLIRIEGVAGSFVDNQSKVKLGEALTKLQSGEMSFADAAQSYGAVMGAGEDGAMDVTRNSVQGPLFEFMAFTTAAGEVSRPFLSPRGYVVLKVNSVKKGEQPALDKVACSAVLFPFSPEDDLMKDAQYTVTSGQAEVLVRDEAVMKMLPALYRPQPPRQTPEQMLQRQLKTLQSRMAKIEAAGEGGSDQAKALRAQVESAKKRLQQLRDEAAKKARPADGRDDFDAPPVIKKARKPSKPGGGN